MSVSIQSCAFSDLTLSEGNGAAISAKVGKGEMVEMKMHSNTETFNTFTRCTASGGVGGAIYVHAEEKATLVVQYSSFNECSCLDSYSSSYSSSLSSLSSSSSSSTSTPSSILTHGACIFVSTPSPSSLFIRSRWRGTVDSRNEDLYQALWMRDTTNNN